jgi:hypothetical protein
MRTITSAAVAALTAGFLVATPATAEQGTARALDPSKPIRAELTVCVTEADRDCIESIALITPAGAVVGRQVTPTSPVVYEPVRDGGSQSGPVGGRVIDQSGGDWTIPGLQIESGPNIINPFIAITTPGLRWYEVGMGRAWDVPAQLLIELHSTSFVELPADPPCDPQGTCSRPVVIDPDQTFRVVVRTSWFDPSWGRSHLGDTKLRVTPMRDGGSRITVEGYALNSPGFFTGGGRNPDVSEREQIDYFDYRWTVYLMDSNDPRFPEQCSRHGFPLISGNQWGSGTPQWYPGGQRLSLNMSAPHFAPDGSAFRGHYEAFIPTGYARCLWQTDPRRLANQLMVEVTAENGEEKAATTSITFRDGGVRIVARNFTFSSPKITVKPKKKRR